jgi:hypothetical protein
MNSDLYGKSFTVPDDVIDYLHQCHQAVGDVDETTEGFKRNKDLREKGEITYQQLKRMKNWFDNFNGHEDDISHILNGGHYVKNWVNDTLNSKRDSVENGKETKSEVLPNQYNQEHEKNDMTTMNRSSKSHDTMTNQYTPSIREDLNRINDLIKKIL